jgi:hypothetical protein
MALLCEHGSPINYNDNDNYYDQWLGVKDRAYGKDMQHCILFKDTGLHNLWPNSDPVIQHYNDTTDGIRVRPGYKIRVYEHDAGKGDYRDYDGGETGTNYFIGDSFGGRISSIKVEKDCTKNVMTWDDACASDPTNKQNRKNTCGNNLAAHPKCKEWCKTNSSECSAAISSYCNGLPIDTMVSDPLCPQNVENTIIDDKCKKSENFNTNTCKQYCTNHPEKCTAAIENYCKNTGNMQQQICKTFCEKAENKRACLGPIKNYCKSYTIKSDPWCQKILSSEIMRNEYNDEMKIYCNNEGKNNLSNIEEADLNKARKINDNLTNPICACYDDALLEKKFGYVKNFDIKSKYLAHPECFYYNCMQGTGVYKKNSSDCKAVICNIQFDDVDIKNSSNIKIENNCGNSPTSPSTGGSSGNSGINSDNKIDCQMSEWTKCSKTCSEGIQTREKILDPMNGGKPCGPIVQTCKIPCTTLKEQLQNSTFNFFDLDKTNKILVILIVGFICGVIIFIN